MDQAFCLGNCFCLTNIFTFSFAEWVCGESLFIIIILITFFLEGRLKSFLTDSYLQYITKYDSIILYILLLPWRIKHPSLFCHLCWGNWVLPRCFEDILSIKIVSCVGASVWAHVCYEFQSVGSEWELKTSTHDPLRHQMDSIEHCHFSNSENFHLLSYEYYFMIILYSSCMFICSSVFFIVSFLIPLLILFLLTHVSS